MEGILDFITWQGLPTAIVFSGMFLITTDPAPIVHHFPIVTPGIITEPAPIIVPSPIITFPHKVVPGEMCYVILHNAIMVYRRIGIDDTMLSDDGIAIYRNTTHNDCTFSNLT